MPDEVDSRHQKEHVIHRRPSMWKAQKTTTRRSVNVSASGIHNDDAGIFVTCDKGQESKCLREMDDILSEHLKLHQDNSPAETTRETFDDCVDIEKNIEKELEAMKSTYSDYKRPYTFVKLEISCVSFIRTPAPLDPVSMVRQICEDAYSEASPQRTRFVRRLTPVSCLRKTLGNGLEQLCEAVLPPAFGAGITAKKFAIRPTIRNNGKMDRDTVIKTVADAVHRLNPDHSVDLVNYGCLILVEVYRNVCGMSVVGAEFEKLRRFNLSEIYQASRPEGFRREKDST